MNITLRGVLLVAVIATMPSCKAPEASGDLQVTPTVVQSITRYRKEYVLVPGDRLDVVVRNHPEISRVFSNEGRGVIVRPDGNISMPLLNDVRVAGKTMPEVDELLTERLSHRIVDPEVTVIWLSLREPMVYVVGEVRTPRAVEHRIATTAAQAITHAGGLNPDTADKEKVVIIRLTDDGYLRATTIPVGVKGQPGAYMALQATILQPDDVILVPETGIAQFDRWVTQNINVPLSGVNSVLQPVTNYLLIQDLIEN